MRETGMTKRITHLVLELLHRLELFYGKQKTSRRNEMRDIESDFKADSDGENEMRHIKEQFQSR